MTPFIPSTYSIIWPIAVWVKQSCLYTITMHSHEKPMYKSSSKNEHCNEFASWIQNVFQRYSTLGARGYFCLARRRARNKLATSLSHDLWDKDLNLFPNTLKHRLSGPRLSGLFLWSQFGHEYLLVTIKICSHILFKTTALKSAVKCKGFLLSKSKALTCVVTNEEHEFWLPQSHVVAKWDFMLYGLLGVVWKTAA